MIAAKAATQRITLTYFADYRAARKTERQVSLDALVEQIKNTTAAEKAKLPWLKLARFGDVLTAKGSLRHDRNVIAVTGAEIDYDGELVDIDAAIRALEKAGVLGILYTSPSYRPAAPRWRALCPFGRELKPEQRGKMVNRLNGLLDGIANRESWTLSQAYYFGSVDNNPHHRVELIDGIPLDELHELDQGALGPPRPAASSNGRGSSSNPGPFDEQALLEQIRRGASYHVPSVQLAGIWANRGVPEDFAKTRLRDAFEAVQLDNRDERWRLRLKMSIAPFTIFTKNMRLAMPHPVRMFANSRQWPMRHLLVFPARSSG